MKRKKKGDIWAVGLRVPTPVRLWILDQLKEARVSQSALVTAALMDSVERLPELLKQIRTDEGLLERAALRHVHRARRSPIALKRVQAQERALEERGASLSENATEAESGAIQPQKPARDRSSKPKLSVVEGGSEASAKRAGQGELLQTLSAIKFPGDFLVADVYSEFVKYLRASNQSAKLTDVPEFAAALRDRGDVLRAWGKQRSELVQACEELKRKANVSKGRMKRLFESRRHAAVRALEEFDRVRRLDQRPLLKLFFRVHGR